MRYLVPLLLVPILLIAYQAHAQDERMCTMQYAPVCGAKPVQCVAAPCYPVYQTYGNSCVMGVEGGQFIHEGECTAEETGPVKPKSDEAVLTFPAEHTNAAVQAMEEIATATPEKAGFFENVWSTLRSWFIWIV